MNQGFSQVLLPIYTLFPAAPARMPPFSCNTSTHPAPLNPLSRGETSTPQITHYQKETSISKLPSREGQGVCHACAQPPQTKNIYPKPRNTTSPNSSKNISSHAAHLIVTHPSIPSQEGNPTRHQTSHYQQENSIPNLPSREGPGVCDVCAQPQKIQSSHPKPRKTSSPNSSKNISTHTAPLTVTHPSSPSREGNPTRHKSLITNKKTAFQTSPLERGGGCVTSAHSFLKSKASTQSRQILHNSTNNNKCNISQQLSKNISPHAAPLTVTHPSIPSQEGNPPHHQTSHFQIKKPHPNLPVPERGRRCVTSKHSYPNQKLLHFDF